MKDSNLSKKVGLILLGLLTLIFRFPVTESPTGSDNFYYISAVSYTHLTLPTILRV